MAAAFLALVVTHHPAGAQTAADAAPPVSETDAGVQPEGGDAAPTPPVRRVAAIFDFEEEDNPYPVPRHWVRAQDADKSPRAGFPRFNQAAFDFEIAHAGTTSVQLPTYGGSTSLRLAAGVIPVFADGDYAVTAWVRTAGLNHARAFVCTRLLDQACIPIAGAEVRSEPLDTRGEWSEVSLQLIGAPASAAYLQVEFQLLQPRQFQEPLPDRRDRIWPEDLSGAAWFDDTTVYQLPRVEITTGAPANIVLAPERPVVRILVRDFVGEKLDGRLIVTDIDDRVIEDASIPLATSGRQQEWALELPAFGWYHVTMGVLGEKVDGSKYRVGGAELSLLWLRNDPRAALPRVAEGSLGDRHRFGIIADRIEADLRPSLAAVGRAIRTGFVSIPLWDENVRRGGMAAAVPALGQTIDELSQAGQQLIICIPSVPGEVLVDHQIGADDPLALADIDPAKWMPYLQPVLDRYGQRLTSWQIGCAGVDGAFWRPDLNATADKIGMQLATLVPGPRVWVPWRAEYTFPPGVPGMSEGGVGAMVISYPAEFASDTLSAFIRDLFAGAPESMDAAPAEVVIVPELPTSDLFGERAVVTELARRAVEFWVARTSPDNAARPAGLALSHPWRRVGEHRPQLMPAASLGAYRTLIAHLSERQVVGEYAVAPGIKCYILADRANEGSMGPRGALVAWNISAAPEDAVIRRFLGDGTIEAVDIFGNRSPVARSGENGGPHEVRVGETPMFIEGADPMLAKFCTQVSVEPAFLPAVQVEHELALVITNPWPQAISGKMQIVPPEGAGPASARRRWSVTPAGIIPFSLGAGQTKRIPWTASFPYLEETGVKLFSVVVRVVTDRELPPIVLPLSVQVGFQDLAIEPEVQLGPGLDGPDVVLTATITNRGEQSRMLKFEAVAPGMPTRQTLIADLPPGESVIRRIVLKNAAAQLSGRRVYLSVSDPDGQERLNTSVLVP